MNKETAARQAVILTLMRGFPSSQGQVTEGVLASYVSSVEEFSVDALQRACSRLLTGDVPGRNNSFIPTAAEVAEQTRLFHDVLVSIERNKLERKPVEHGMIEVDFGGGRIDLRGRSLAEVKEIFFYKGLPPKIAADGRSVSAKLKSMRFTAGDRDGERDAG